MEEIPQMMTRQMPQSVEVTKHMIHQHLKTHFQAPMSVIKRLNVIAEIPCDCEAGNSVLVCAVCGDVLVARVQNENICNCLKGFLDG
jgi:kynurenine formamidase